MPEEQSVHARDGVADPQGCGNPLRSGMAGLSFAAASPPHPQESASSRPRTHPPEATPLSRRERPAMPEEQSVHVRDGVADPQGCGNPLRSGVAGLSLKAASPPHPQEYASSRPRTHPPEATPHPGEKGLPCPKSKASTPRMAWPIRRDAGILCDRAWRAFRSQRPHCRHRLPCTPHKKNGRPGFP